MKKCAKKRHEHKWGGSVFSAAEIRRYRRVSTARKLQWLDEMRHLFFAAMTPEIQKRWAELRKRGY